MLRAFFIAMFEDWTKMPDKLLQLRDKLHIDLCIGYLIDSSYFRYTKLDTQFALVKISEFTVPQFEVLQILLFCN